MSTARPCRACDGAAWVPSILQKKSECIFCCRVCVMWSFLAYMLMRLPKYILEVFPYSFSPPDP